MSVGAFLGIRPSFNDESAARAFLGAIADVLSEAGFPPYGDPAPSPNRSRRGLGRSSLDQQSAGALIQLAHRAERSEDARHLRVIADNAYRVAFLPLELPAPIKTAYADPIGGTSTAVWIASAPALYRALIRLAPALGIPLAGDTLSDETAGLIDEGESLDENDFADAFESERLAWLMLFEGARIALAERTALSLAG